MKEAKSCVAVVGSGRSGTSAAAQLLAQLGVSIEKSLDAAGDQNPLGFSEDAEIVRMNKALEEQLSGGPQLPPDLSALEQIRPIEKELADYIKRKVDEHELWGFKDPRTSLYLPVYRGIFNRLRIVPKWVFCVRDPAATVASFVSHGRLDSDLAQLAWFSRNLGVLRDSGLNCFILHYEKLIENPVEQARRLADFLHEDAERPAIDDATIKHTVRPGLDRSGMIPARITNPLVDRLYSALQTCEGADFHRTALRDVVKELSDLERAFLPWAKASRRRDVELKSVEELRSESSKLSAENAELATKLDEQAKAQRELAAENAKLAGQVADARLIAEDYQRQAVHSEETLKERLSAARRKLADAKKFQREQEESLKGVKAKKLRQIERERAQAELPYRIGKLVLDVYKRPLSNGIRLPGAMLALRADSRRKRAERARPQPKGK